MLGYLKSLLRLPSAVKFYLLSEMLFGVGVGMAVIFNFHYLALGFDTRVIGIATACNSITVALCSYPAGMFSDRYGAKKAMALGTGLAVAGYVMIGQVTSETGLYAAQILLGIGTAFVISCEFPYIMSLCERKEDETTAYNLLIAAFTLALSLGNILGTKLPPLLPQGTTMYQTTVWLVALCFFLMFILRLFLPAKSKRLEAEQQSKPTGSWRIVPSRAVVIYVIYATLGGLVYFSVGPFENVILRERFGLSDDTVGYITAVNSFAVFLISLFTPYVMQTRTRRMFIYGAFLVQMAVQLTMSFVVPVYLFALMVWSKGMTATAMNSAIDSSMMKATEESERGLHSGMRNLTRSLCGSLASWLGGVILAGGDYRTVYLVAFGAVCLQVIFYLTAVRKQLQQDLEELF